MIYLFNFDFPSEISRFIATINSNKNIVKISIYNMKADLNPSNLEQFLIFLNNTRYLEKLYFFDFNISSEQLQKIFTSFKNIPNLKKLILDGGRVDSASLEVLLKNLPEKSNLGTIKLEKVQLTDNDATILSKYLTRTPLKDLTNLGVGENQFSFTGIEKILIAAKSLKNLQQMSLYDSKILNQDGVKIGKHLSEFTSLQDIVVSSDTLTATGYNPLVKLISKNPVIKTLRITGKHCKGDILEQMLEAIETGSNFRRLIIEIPNITQTEINALLSAIEKNPNFNQLWLYAADLTDKLLKYFLDELTIRGIKLETLCLQKTKGTDQFLKVLGQYLSNDRDLKRISFSLKEMSVKGEAFLARGLQGNTTLTALKIKVDSGNMGLTHGYLFKAVAKNTTLKQLYFENFDFNIEANNHFIALVRQNSSLEKIGLINARLAVHRYQEILDAVKQNTSLIKLKNIKFTPVLFERNLALKESIDQIMRRNAFNLYQKNFQIISRQFMHQPCALRSKSILFRLPREIFDIIQQFLLVNPVYFDSFNNFLIALLEKKHLCRRKAVGW